MRNAAGPKFVCHFRNIQLTHDGTFKGKIDRQEITENYILSSEEKVWTGITDFGVVKVGKN